MSRKIKFRAWHKEEKKMGIAVSFDSIELEVELIDEIEKPFLTDEPEFFELMQYTGLKDKNGVEIYEGDIINGGIYKQYIVKWDALSNHQNIGFNINYMAQYDFEVIGNIYENHELLEAQDERPRKH